MPRQRASIRVSGSELRLQRFQATIAVGGSPTFLPSTVSGLVGWWDFSDQSTLYTDAGTTLVASDGDAIYQCNDKSTNGKNLIQASATARPLYKTAIRSGHSVARFDGSNDSMGTPTMTATTAASYFVVAVKRSAPGAGAQDLFAKGAGTSEFLSLAGWSATDWVYYKNQAGNQVALTGATATSWGIIGAVHSSAASLKAYYNGTQVGSFDPDDAITTSQVTTFGDYANGGGQNADVDIAEILYYNVALAAADHNNVGTYLANKYGLTWTAVS